MKKYLIKAYGDYEYGLKNQEVVIEAETLGEAREKAWRLFPEYKEIGVWEKEQ